MQNENETMQKQTYTVVEVEVFSGPYLSVRCGAEEVGRVLTVGEFFHGRHTCRHQGAIFQNYSEAIEYIVGLDLVIEARFAGTVEIDKMAIAA